MKKFKQLPSFLPGTNQYLCDMRKHGCDPYSYWVSQGCEAGIDLTAAPLLFDLTAAPLLFGIV